MKFAQNHRFSNPDRTPAFDFPNLGEIQKNKSSGISGFSGLEISRDSVILFLAHVTKPFDIGHLN